jgi:hypothetical protein
MISGGVVEVALTFLIFQTQSHEDVAGILHVDHGSFRLDQFCKCHIKTPQRCRPAKFGDSDFRLATGSRSDSTNSHWDR